MAESLLELDGLTKRFGEHEAVSGIDLEITEGEFVALMGPSGCGKTTTLRMIAGLEEPTSGEVRLDGERVNERKPWERDTPMVWQSLALFPYLSVRGNVEFGLKMRSIPARERRARALKWLEQVGIADYANRNIAQLSGGERQRVALARALVTEPRILLLDEPLSALDAHLRVRMQAEITELQRRLGITFVYVTHNQSEAFAMASRVVIMDAGRIQQIGAPREVYRVPANRFVAEFVGTNNLIEGRVRSVRGWAHQSGNRPWRNPGRRAVGARTIGGRFRQSGGECRPGRAQRRGRDAQQRRHRHRDQRGVHRLGGDAAP